MALMDDDTPGPSGLPFIGISYHFARDPFGFRERCADEYGDVVELPLGGGTAGYMLLHPDHVKRVLVTENEKFEGAPAGPLRELLGDGLLVNEGAAWRRQRKLMQPAFSYDRIDEYADSVEQLVSERVRDWPTDEPVDIERRLRVLSLEIIMELFVETGHDPDYAKIVDAFEATDPKFEPSVLSLPDWIPTPANRSFERATETLENEIEAIVEARRRSNESADDLLSVLLEAVDDGRMSESLLRDELMTMLLAGHETTAGTLAFAFLLLGNHPDHQERARAEAASALRSTHSQPEDGERFEYIHRVLKETMRLYPVAHSIARQATEDVVFDGHTIPAGSPVFLAQWVTHRDDRFWRSPTEFRPDRWADSEAASERPTYAYFPFGAGPQRCIGDTLSTVISKRIIAAVLSRYRVESLRDEVDLTVSVTAKPKRGVPVLLE